MLYIAMRSGLLKATVVSLFEVRHGMKWEDI